MAQLYLPVAHTEADLVLAGQIAERIDSAELYVSWTPEHGRAVPELMAELRARRDALDRRARRSSSRPCASSGRRSCSRAPQRRGASPRHPPPGPLQGEAAA